MSRFLWNPLLPMAMLAWFVYRTTTVGSNALRIGGLIIGGIWFGLAAYDWASGGRFRAFVYGDEES